MLPYRRTNKEREKIFKIMPTWEYPIQVKNKKYFFRYHPKNEKFHLKAMINIRRPGMNRGLYYSFPFSITVNNVKALISRHTDELLTYGKK